MVFVSATIDVGYPVYGAKFYNQSTLIITGGGGEGNNGIPNKISSISVRSKEGQFKTDVLREFEFEEKTDSPTGLALADDGTLLIGCNDNSANIKNGENKHLRKFNVTKDFDFKFIDSVDLEKKIDPNEYQKVTLISSNGKNAAMVSSSIPSVLRRFSPATLHEISYVECKQEIKDADITDNGDIVYITETNLYILTEGKSWEYKRASSNYSFTRVKFTHSGEILVGVNLVNKGGILLQLLQVDDGRIKPRKTKVISTKVSRITALDVSNDLVAVASNDNSIIIISLEDFHLCQTLKKVHTFAITKVTFSPNGKVLASTSAANTVNFFGIPDNILSTHASLRASIWVIFIAILFYFFNQAITPERKNAIDYWILYLSGEDVSSFSLSSEEYAKRSVDSIATNTIAETVGTVFKQHTVIEEEDIVHVYISSYADTESEKTSSSNNLEKTLEAGSTLI